MGADLYVDSVFKEDPRIEAIGKKLDKARSALKELPEGSPKEVVTRLECREKALCDEYGKVLDKMFCVENGYFRDSYNSSNLLWVLGLNYWQWLGGFIDGKGYLHPQHARIILERIESTPVTETNLRSHFKNLKIELGKDGKPADEEFAEWLGYFTGKRERFIRFLKTAIETNSPILCSI